MRIITYSNPFEMNHNEELWDLLTNHPQYCASDTLVQGMCAEYGKQNFPLIRPIQDLINAFLGNYLNNPVNDMGLFLAVSDYIRSWDDCYLKESFLFNKGEVVQAIKLLIPLDCRSVCFDKDNLSEEQKRFLDIYNHVQNTDYYQSFKDVTELTFDDYKEAVRLTCCAEVLYLCKKREEYKKLLGTEWLFKIRYSLDAARDAIDEVLHYLREKSQDPLELMAYADDLAVFEQLLKTIEIKDDSYYKSVVINGVHKITPELYFLVQTLEKIGVHVFFVFNYAKNIPAIYQTWKKVYSWCDTEFECAQDLDISSGKPAGRAIAHALSGKELTEPLDYTIKHYDNLTAFAMHQVSPVFSAARRSNPAAPLGKMKVQYYAVKGDECNEILKMFYPEQFEQKPFLSYPIGQLILGLYQMWDFEDNLLRMDYDKLSECAVSGLFKNSDKLLHLLKITRLYFSDIETYEDYCTRFQLLRKANEFAKSSAYDSWKKIAFFHISDEDLDTLDSFFQIIHDYATLIFKDMSRDTNYITHFMNMMNVITENGGKSGSISETERNLINEIQSALSESGTHDIKGNPLDLKDALTFFLASRNRKDSSNWIVRDFEQIDGAVLLSRHRTGAEEYQFALLSNEHMLSRKVDELPWPLNDHMFDGYQEVKKGITAFITSRQERRNFLKYNLFYGCFFSSVPISFSYVGEEQGNEQTPYYLLRTIGLKVEPDTSSMSGLIHKTPNQDPEPFSFTPNLEEKELFAVCPYKYLINKVFKTDIEYSSEYHLKYFMSFCVSSLARKRAKRENVSLVVALAKEMDIVKNFFPFWGQVVLSDIEKDAQKQLQTYSSVIESICRKKENFLVAQWIDGNYNMNQRIASISLPKMNDYMRASRIYPNCDELPPNGLCNDCCFETVCLRNYFEPHEEDSVNDT